ncbi:hypothetical protein Bca4012_000124 [Brassica carinata]|uniref:Secreted protein n=2 Tax=Brassica TaxID=3705 RepID=A0ABQ8A563_BRANA|nr:hypothetical protein Bca52824_005858 [Brassica carinata]KAH0887672.1 hypothetical protein HID58_050101 [Brassica napus]
MKSAASQIPRLVACTRVAILILEGTHVTRSAQYHRVSSTPEIQPSDHTAKPEIHRSVPLYLQTTLGHSNRRASIAVARAHPLSLTAETRERNRMHLYSFRRSSSISSDEHTINRNKHR